MTSPAPPRSNAYALAALSASPVLPTESDVHSVVPAVQPLPLDSSLALAPSATAEALIASLSDRLDTAEDIVKTIHLALLRGYSPAEILDENSPVYDRIRSFK